MHRFLIFSLVFFLVFPMNAVTFDELCEKLTAHRVTSGTFLQEKTAKALKKPLLSSGTFRIDEHGIEWRTEKPFKSTMKVNKTELIQISADGKTTKMDGSSNAVFMSVADTISAIFLGNKDALNTNFAVDFADEGETWHLQLEPKDATIKSALSTIEMWGNPDSDTFDRVKVTQASGDTILYTFANQTH